MHHFNFASKQIMDLALKLVVHPHLIRDSSPQPCFLLFRQDRPHYNLDSDAIHPAGWHTRSTTGCIWWDCCTPWASCWGTPRWLSSPSGPFVGRPSLWAANLTQPSPTAKFSEPTLIAAAGLTTRPWGCTAEVPFLCSVFLESWEGKGRKGVIGGWGRGEGGVGRSCV